MARKPNPDEKKTYDRIVLQALRHLMKPEQAATVEKMAQASNPAEAVASATAMVIKQVVSAADMAGKKLTAQFIYPAAKEVMMHLIEMLVVFKSLPREQAEQTLQQAMQMFAQITGGEGGAPQQQPQQPAGMLAQGA